MDDLEFDLEELEFLEKDKSLAKRRRTNRSKALSKARKAKNIYRTFTWYDNLHQYSKNKIFCSCPMCSVKTNTQIYKSKGPMSTHHMRQSGSNHRYGRKNYKLSDLRKIDSLLYSEDAEAV